MTNKWLLKYENHNLGLEINTLNDIKMNITKTLQIIEEIRVMLHRVKNLEGVNNLFHELEDIEDNFDMLDTNPDEADGYGLEEIRLGHQECWADLYNFCSREVKQAGEKKKLLFLILK